MADYDRLMLSKRRTFIGFRMTAGRALRRYWLRARPIRMKLTKASSQLGERFGIDWLTDRKSTRLNSSHIQKSRMPSSA